MAEILGLASSIIAVVGLAGKLSTSTLQLKRLWDEVQDVPASVRRCIEHLEFLAPAIEEMDDEFQRTRTMVQSDSAAKRSLEYSRKAVTTLESLVRDMEAQLNTAKKGRRLVAQLKVRMKKEAIEEHQQQLQSVLQLVSLSQQTYLIALSRAQPGIIISEIKNWQESNRQPQPSESSDQEDGTTDDEGTTGTVVRAEYTMSGSRNTWASKHPIPWRNGGLFGSISYFSHESEDRMTASQAFQLRVQPPNWLASKAWDLHVCRALTGWNVQMRTWTTRPRDSEIFRWVKEGSTDKVIQAIMNKEASLYDRNPGGKSLSTMALMASNLGLLRRLIALGISLDDICVGDAIFTLLRTPIAVRVTSWQDLERIWADNKEELLKALIDEQSGLSKVARTTKLWNSLECPDSVTTPAFIEGIDWELADPEVVLELISKGLVNVYKLRTSTLMACQLQDFAAQYFHEYINCSPWMNEWRLITQRLFQNTTWEDLAALHIDKIVKDIWRWQFPLGPFEKWLKRGLRMLKEDLTIAGLDVKEIASSHDIQSDQRIMKPMRWVKTLIGACSWDPCIETLAGDFWSMIETTQLRLPGSWVSDDEDDIDTINCVFGSGEKSFSCLERRRKFYRGNECTGNQLVRVRGMMTCREMYPMMDFNGDKV